MDQERFIGLLERVRSGDTGVSEAVEELKYLPFRDIGSARSTTTANCAAASRRWSTAPVKPLHRRWRPSRELATHSDRVLATRVPPRSARLIQDEFPNSRLPREARLLYLCTGQSPGRAGRRSPFSPGAPQTSRWPRRRP